MRSRKARLVTATALALCGVAATREADSYFTVALIPDTQNYTSIDHELNYDQMRYLVRARDSLKLAFVVHLGDLTDSNLEHEDQWDVADDAHQILDDAQIPYSVIPGNHDMRELNGDSVLSRDLSVYNSFFGPSRFSDANGNPLPWTGFGGYMADAPENKYWLFEARGLRFLVLGLELAPRKDAVCWANDIAKRFSDRRIIVATHCYQAVGGGHQEKCAVRYGLVGSGGDVLFDELIRMHSNIIFAVSGHFNEAAYKPRPRNFGPGRADAVHEIITDYQNERNDRNEKSGNGWLRLMTFFPDDDSVKVTAYTVRDTIKRFKEDRYPKVPSDTPHTFRFDLNLGPLPNVIHIDTLNAFHDRTVNPKSSGQQRETAVAASNNGAFVVAWTDDGGGTGTTQVNARAFDANGCQLFRITPVHQVAAGNQRDPAVAMDQAGNSVIVWEDDRNNDGEYDVYARGFKANGSVAFEEVAVTTHPLGQQLNPAVGMAANGDFVVAWQDDADTNHVYQVLARRFNSRGQPATNASGRAEPETTVNTVSTGQQRRPDIAVRPNGDFVVVWEDDDNNNDKYQIRARGFRASGAPLISEFTVNAVAAGQQTKPAIAVAPSGHFVVTWADDRNNNDTYQIRARRFDANGSPLSTDILVNTVSTGEQIDPDVAVAHNRSFVIVWADDRNNNDSYQIRSRTFDAAGAGQANDAVVNYNPAGHQLKPAVAVMGQSRRIVVVWEDDSNGNDQFEILARGMARPAAW
jgi:hypothetical protein